MPENQNFDDLLFKLLESLRDVDLSDEAQRKVKVAEGAAIIRDKKPTGSAIASAPFDELQARKIREALPQVVYLLKAFKALA